jgi:hypothetical protein
MDVKNVVRNAYQNVAGGANAVRKQDIADEKILAAQTEEVNAGEAYAVELSGKQPAATNTAVDNTAAAKNAEKGLSADAVKQMQADIDNSYSVMIATMTEHNSKMQSWLSAGIGTLRFGDVLVDAYKFALPEVGTTPEEAAKAIAPGGAYSVEAVADRVFGLAEALANGDPKKLEEMRAAVEKGFEQAGVAFKDATGAKGMPQITQDTHTEIMKRFDDLQKKLTGNEQKSKVAAVDMSM